MLSSTERPTLGRARERARLDHTDLYEVLDAGRICHLGVIVDGAPRVIPTGYGRSGDTLFLHGSTGARSLRPGSEVCVTVTHLDGLVLARSAFHPSINYRSAVLFGTPVEGTSPDEKPTGLRATTEQLPPARGGSVGLRAR